MVDNDECCPFVLGHLVQWKRFKEGTVDRPPMETGNLCLYLTDCKTCPGVIKHKDKINAARKELGLDGRC